MPNDPYVLFQDLRDALRAAKPSDRSSLDRHYAIILTDLEKIIAYFKTYCTEATAENAGDSESKPVRVD